MLQNVEILSARERAPTFRIAPSSVVGPSRLMLSPHSYAGRGSSQWWGQAARILAMHYSITPRGGFVICARGLLSKHEGHRSPLGTSMFHDEQRELQWGSRSVGHTRRSPIPLPPLGPYRTECLLAESRPTSNFLFQTSHLVEVESSSPTERAIWIGHAQNLMI